MNISATTTPNCAPRDGIGGTPTTSGPATCPPGQHSTTNNGGTSYCVFDAPADPNAAPKNSERTTSPTTRTANPDGSTTDTQTTTTKNSDGSTTTTTRTTRTASDGTKTESSTGTTGLTPGGTQGKSDGTDADKSDFCKQNPTLNVCKNSTVDIADCKNGSGVTACTGDAIQCAMFRQSRKEYCESIAPTPQSTLGDSLLRGVDPNAATLPTPQNGETINVNTGLNRTGFIGGGSCFPDRQIVIGTGQTLTLPFSMACPYLIPLRVFLMMMATFASFMILQRSVLG
jgi:hypothetical protein